MLGPRRSTDPARHGTVPRIKAEYNPNARFDRVCRWLSWAACAVLIVATLDWSQLW